ncbi:DUF4437 domain-containing protein [Streptosporangium sp. NPDC001681]|uniref:cupin domain-containing protein n=1 Tax=Streptosporangium sp. NPDC001681 TaxID=3154395 RepID=UPI003329BCBA
MNRPFIEFLQTQRLAWSGAGGVREGAEVRELSRDAATGACSTLVRYPAGWRRERDEALDTDEEFFVLSGSLRIGEVDYGRYSYGHLPSGYHRAGMSSPAGAVVLTFFAAEAHAIPTSSHLPTLVSERVVERIDALDGAWGGGFHPEFPPGAGRKWLRRDPVTGDETWVLGTMPLRQGQKAERHPVVEEMFLLSGELVGHLGIMRPGAYFWRPPEEWHGPFGSLTGNLMLFRTVGGPLSTEYHTERGDFCWEPEHRPILPPHLRDLPSPEEPSKTDDLPLTGGE